MKSIANLSGSEVTEAEIRRYMRMYVGHGKPPTSTELAEAAAEHFDLYEDEVDYPIPERLFEISEEILPTE